MSDDPIVLFVEDDAALRHATVQSLELAGLKVEAHPAAPPALERLAAGFPGVIVSDIRLPRMDGLQLLAAVKEIDPDIPVILVTGHGDVPTAVRALQAGALDFITKPFSVDHLVEVARRGLSHRALVLENRALKAAASAGQEDFPLVGASPAMVRLRASVDQLARSDVDVLVEGETGTGKEVVALLLHRRSKRKGRPFVAVNCGGLRPDTADIELFGHASESVAHTRRARQGQIALAGSGVLLLDEIDSLALPVQASLLRVIEEREIHPVGADEPVPVDVRIIATTKVDLAQAVAEGRFRADLYYRLATVRLRVPALREREGDALQLFAGFVEEAKQRLGRPDFQLDEVLRRKLHAHDWPGNVRELRNFAYEAVLGLAGASDVPGDGQNLPSRVAAFEAEVIAAALRQADGRVERAVELLGIPRKTFYDKIARHRIDLDEFRPARAQR
jgi:two-component system C4-dicarboxylate transport response regulator DctD